MTEPVAENPGPGGDVQTEVKKIVYDKTNAWHDAWHGRQGPERQKPAQAHMLGLYRPLPESQTPAMGTEHVEAGGEAQTDARAQEAMAKFAPIKQALIESPDFPDWTAQTYGENMQLARDGARHVLHHLFGGNADEFEAFAKKLGDDVFGMDFLRQVGQSVRKRRR